MLKENTFMLKKYRRLFVAAILGWLVELLGGMADSVLAGLYLDAEAVAAVELVSPLTTLLYCISILVGLGCAMMYSNALGAFKKETSEKLAGMGLLTSLVLGLILGAAVWIFKDPILNFYGCTGMLREYANQYYIPNIVLAFFSPVFWFIYYMVTYDGDETIVLSTDTFIAVANLAISCAVVNTQGIFGLSIGTAAAELLGGGILLIHFAKKTNSIKFKPYFNFKDLGEMLVHSSSMATTTCFLAVVDIIFNKFIINQFGEEFLPAYTVVNSALNGAAILFCVINAASPFVSIAYGEDNIFALRRYMKIVNRDSVITAAVFSIILVVIAPLWAEVYAITDPAVVQASLYAGRVVPLTYIAVAFVYTYISYYPLIDKPLAGNLLSFTYMLAGPIVLAIPAGIFWGYNGMSFGFALTPIFAIVVEIIYFAITKQLKKAPILLDNNKEVEAHYEIRLEEANIIALRDKVEEFLKSQNIVQTKIVEILMVLEDTLVYIKNKNGNKKKLLCECVVLVGDEYIRMITKDNGVIFDMIKEADDNLDLRCYVVARMMEEASEKSNTTTISFNRNTYIWNRKEEE